MKLCKEVRRFTEAMQYKIDKNKHKDGWPHKKGERSWKTCSVDFLLKKLSEECFELKAAIILNNNKEDIKNEAADVANIAMMLADNVNALN